jgi:hypothetical protein
VLLAEACGCAIGLATEVPDRTAGAFAAEFYRAVAFGYAVGPAVRIAAAALELHGLDGHEAIRVAAASGVDPDTIFLVPSHLQPPSARDTHKPDATAAVAHTGKTPFAAILTGTGESASSLTTKLSSIDITDLEVQWIQLRDRRG